jgi:hypothetical protein
MAKPTVYDELYPGRFLKAALLKGTKPTLTIKDVDLEELVGEDGKPKAKAILSFEERPMQLVMCKTNGLSLKAMFGPQLKEWIGKRVTLFESQWNGEPAIRVWGSPDLASDKTVSIALPRRRPFDMVLHSVKQKQATNGKKEADAVHDPRIVAAWELLGWSKEEGATDKSKFTGLDAGYLAYLNGLIDAKNAEEVTA